MFTRLKNFFTLYTSLVRDPRVPARSKYLPWIALIYLIVPIDILPDFIPLLGQIDDIGVIVILLLIAINAISDKTYDEHRKKYESVIDVTPDEAQKTSKK